MNLVLQELTSATCANERNDNMKQFDITDVAGIEEYIKSLDLFDQFGEITVDLLGEIRSMINESMKFVSL